ncbi:MAG TPA: helix-turn-helix domain-containing protein [Yinghuangia sp.]|nr:helix-turn-helix domain-containing protein [Yinghuangia sp.]
MHLSASGGVRWTAVPGIGVIGTSGITITTEHLTPSGEFADVVARFWSLRWTVHPGFERHASAVSLLDPDPLVVLNGKSLTCQGITRHRRTSSPRPGTGVIYAAALRPGVVARLLGGTAADHNDRCLPLSETAWGLSAHRVGADLHAAAARDGLAGFAVAFEQCLPTAPPLPADPEVARVGAMVDAIRDEGLTRVVELVDHFHLSARTIQRAFNRHMGVSPKWLLRRYRVLRGAYRLQYDPPRRSSELASALGYFDDSHFARDFADLLGSTPAVFAQRLQGSDLTGRQPVLAPTPVGVPGAAA